MKTISGVTGSCHICTVAMNTSCHHQGEGEELSSPLVPVAWDSHCHWALKTFLFQFQRFFQCPLYLYMSEYKQCLGRPGRKGQLSWPQTALVSCKTSPSGLVSLPSLPGGVRWGDRAPGSAVSLTNQALGRWPQEADFVSLHCGRATSLIMIPGMHHGWPLWLMISRLQMCVSPAWFKFSLDGPLNVNAVSIQWNETAISGYHFASQASVREHFQAHSY